MRPLSPTLSALLALSVTQLIGWGATFWFVAVAGVPMAADLHLPLPFIMVGPTAMLVTMALASWLMRNLFARYGARRIMTAGSPIAAAGLFLMSLAAGLPLYLFAWIVLGVAGACMLTTAAQIALTEVAGKAARRALGILVLAGGLTSTITLPVTSLLLTWWDWRQTAMAYALLLLVLCTPLHWYALSRTIKSSTEVKVRRQDGGIDRARLVLMATSFAANGFFTWGFSLTIIILFEARGLDHASALAAASFIGIAQWAGRLTEVVIGNRWSGIAIALIGALLFPVSFLILLVTGGFPGAIIFASLYGLASGITAVARATLPLDMFPPGTYARITAQMALPLNLAFATAPPVFTLIMTSASPNAALWTAFTIATAAFLCLAGLQLRPAAQTAVE